MYVHMYVKYSLPNNHFFPTIFTTELATMKPNTFDIATMIVFMYICALASDWNCKEHVKTRRLITDYLHIPLYILLAMFQLFHLHLTFHIN